ncbi:uncharacterized protein cd8b [Neoarius graeffei]|uniref:uncharacterized protein cd8b n=1 Tax=Neoarius graeffei TaxID=443677 RepID=UPI00298C31C9|nr:uncharacterized protein cd8b [Neoarius graeffei]
MTLNSIWSFFCFLTAVCAVTEYRPSINSSVTLSCSCPDHQCQKAYWYRLLQDKDTPEFVVSLNNLNHANYATYINKIRFKTAAFESAKVLYTLRITSVQKEDAGFYSCFLKSMNSAQEPKDLLPEGYSVRPGEIITTVAPTTVKKQKKPNICRSNNQSLKGCKSLVLWSGIGAVLLLVVVLISTLYYFSRLPKKCRHRFTRKQQLR